jgi:hypothetical protein
VLFGARESSDHLVAPNRIDFAASPAAGDAPIYATSVKTLPGALYFRVGVRVFSRYEGLLVRSDPSTHERRLPLASRSTGTGRLFVAVQQARTTTHRQAGFAPHQVDSSRGGLKRHHRRSAGEGDLETGSADDNGRTPGFASWCWRRPGTPTTSAEL